MNETVLFLVIGAAIILVGLFLWSRMEAKKNREGKVGLSNLPKNGMYNNPPKRQANQQELIRNLNNGTVGFEVESVTDHAGDERAGVALTPSMPDNETEKPKATWQEIADTTPTAAQTSEVSQPNEQTSPVLPEVPVQTKKPESAAPKEPKQENLFTNLVTEETKETAEPEAPAPSTFPKEGLAHFRHDEVTETVGWVQSNKPVDGKKMMEMVASLQKLNLPLRIYVCRSDNKRWYQPSAVGRYSELAVVLLLANRQGCINEMDASRFASAVQQIGIALEADSDTEASHEIVKRAQKLYKDVMRLDVQLNFVMASKEPLNPNDVAEAARLAGFTQLNPMRYFLGTAKRIAEATIFLHQDDFDRRYLTIALDAPLASPDSNPLRTLFSVSNDLCARLNLQLQDSRDRPINTESAQSINHQLKKYYQEMIKANIEPGSPRARVLFTRD